MRFAIGLVIGLTVGGVGAAVAQAVARVDTNGVLAGYTVQKGSETVCRDPMVWNDFRGQGSFIVCE
ncbi:MAG: hypothetical protein P0Y65_13915 [Candidatus Devosia phytovorans]|uniref:Secreted protein n=1 Tax=Candidatus Devosia phytovorans TaxID=3121372 RepID=A0AAJ5VRH1_9HYPH|nr:hypothetical protein [Devosia sp.]WEK03284.1 MAG: hypothetical protein P0Y65_13915 [Devosia sp.]